MRKAISAGVLSLAFCAAGVAAAEDVASPAPCQLPVVKIYRINPNFCPTTLVHMIPAAVGPACGGCDCGPYGIPPIYAAGQSVIVRQTPEMQERVTEFLTELGALVPKKRAG